MIALQMHMQNLNLKLIILLSNKRSVHEIYPKLEPQNPSFGTGGLLSDFVTIS
jgi:hypothetical protein